MRQAEYRPNECAFCKAETWCEMRADGRPQCRACKIELFFERMLYPPLKMRLMGWQRKVLRDLYGTVDQADGSRQYRHAYISVAKQNGKTFMIGGLPLYHLVCESETDPEAYGCAAAKDQAGLVFKAAARLVKANPILRDRLKLLESTKRLVRRDGGGFYAVLSADGDMQDGIRPSLLLRDEVHRWKTQRAEVLLDVTTRGQISRAEPLDICITTAGAEYESPLWYSEYEHAKRVLSGAVQSPLHYAAIWEADQKRAENDPEYWKSREARVAANPSHEDHGGFLKDAAIVSHLEAAIEKPTERSKYLRYHLNLPSKAQEDPIIDMHLWQACGGPDDLRTWPHYDYEMLARKWGLAGRMCYVGVDASWTTDLTALALIFPPSRGKDIWKLLVFSWLPLANLPKLERSCRVPLADWLRRGFIEGSEGRAIDQRAVVERIKWADNMFDVREVDYDRLNFRSEALTLDGEGITTVEIDQNFTHLSHATKFLLAIYADEKLMHGNNPLLNWMASCLQLKYDTRDNCQPSKPARLASGKRIDGMQAIITALSRAAISQEYVPYKGLRTVNAT